MGDSHPGLCGFKIKQFSLLKMYRNLADLAFGSQPHSRSPYPYAGGNDAVQTVLLQIAAGIFPEKPDHQITREGLAVMGVAAKLQVSAVLGQLGKLTGLMFQNDDGLALVQSG